MYIYIYSNTCCQSIWYTTSITFELFCSGNLPKNLNCCVCVHVRLHISYQNMKIYIHYIGTKAECQQVAIKLNITDDDFWEIVDSWRSDKIWKKVNNDWQLKYPIK